ncbi:MAG: prenyltransferase [Chloroflexota bacterium]|nr:prenyltransferase [Chloroflexota bacterium]
MRESIKDLPRILRAPFFVATATQTLVGAAVAWNEGVFHLGYFLLTVLGVVLANAGTNTANDYFDHLSGDDEGNQELTPFSGGSRVIQDGVISSRGMLALSLLCYGIVVVIGLYLTWARGWGVLAFGLVGVVLSFLYNAKIAYIGRGLGELVTGILTGPVIVCGAYYVQAQRVSPEIVWVSLPVGLLVSLILYVNEFPDYAADSAAGKRTIVVTLGRRRAMPGYIAMVVTVYLSILIGALAGLLPWPTLLAFLTLPLAYRGVQGIHRFYDETPKLIPTCAVTIQMHTATALLFTLGYVIDKFLA